LLTFSEADLT